MSPAGVVLSCRYRSLDDIPPIGYTCSLSTTTTAPKSVRLADSAPHPPPRHASRNHVNPTTSWVTRITRVTPLNIRCSCWGTDRVESTTIVSFPRSLYEGVFSVARSKGSGAYYANYNIRTVVRIRQYRDHCTLHA